MARSCQLIHCQTWGQMSSVSLPSLCDDQGIKDFTLYCTEHWTYTNSHHHSYPPKSIHSSVLCFLSHCYKWVVHVLTYLVNTSTCVLFPIPSHLFKESVPTFLLFFYIILISIIKHDAISLILKKQKQNKQTSQRHFLLNISAPLYHKTPSKSCIYLLPPISLLTFS